MYGLNPQSSPQTRTQAITAEIKQWFYNSSRHDKRGNLGISKRPYLSYQTANSRQSSTDPGNDSCTLERLCSFDRERPRCRRSGMALNLSKVCGWSLVLELKKRRILYLGPCKGCFRGSLVLRDRAVDVARGSNPSKDLTKPLA